MNLEIGKIIKTVGLKGEMKVYPITVEIEQRFSKGCEILINNRKHTIISYRDQKGCPIIKVNDIASIDQAETLIGQMIYVDSNDLPENDGFYGYELKQFSVIYNESVVGRVKGFESFGAQVNMRLEKNDGKSVLIPFIEPFIVEIDEANQQIIMKNLEGLL